MKKLLIGFGITVAVVTVFCAAVNEQWKRDCKEAEHYTNLMHEIIGC